MHFERKLELEKIVRDLGGDIDRLEVLGGGINGYVVKYEAKGHIYILKKHEEDKKERFAAELAFLTYAQTVAAAYVPKIIESDNRLQCIVMEYLDGSEIGSEKEDIKEACRSACRFFELLNNDLTHALVPKNNAAEGFRSLIEHLSCLKARFKRLEVDHLGVEQSERAKSLIVRLGRHISEVNEKTQRAIEVGSIANCMAEDTKCVSPGDFGLHNAIRAKTGIKFLDFEHGGLDDCAKTSLDFMLQPRYALGLREYWLYRYSNNINAGEVSRRIAVLEPIIRLKWILIILGILDRKRLKEMCTQKLIGAVELEFLIAGRLDAAERRIGEFEALQE